MTKLFFNSTNVAFTTWRHVCRFNTNLVKSELIFTIVIIISLKNDLRLFLTNTVKELEENLDFGIQKLIKSEPGMIPVNNDDEKHLGLALAMRMSLNFLTKGKGVGSGQRRNETNLFFHKNWKK